MPNTNQKLVVTVTITCVDQPNNSYSATYAKDNVNSTAGSATVDSDGKIHLSNVPGGVDIIWNLVGKSTQEMTYVFHGTSTKPAIEIVPIDTGVFTLGTVSGASATMADTNDPVQFEYTLNCMDNDPQGPGNIFSLDPRVVNR